MLNTVHFDPWQRSLFVPFVSSANTKEKGPLLAGKAPLCEQPDYKLVQFQLQKLYGEIVQLQSALKDDYNNVEEKSNMYHIPEPIIRRFFPKRVLLCSLSSSFH